MAQSDEHRFVTSSFIDIVEHLSRSELFGYREAERGGFDFACILERDRSRPLVGQTLTHHSEGIEKDINWLLFADEAEIPVYLYSDVARNVSRIRDVLTQARTKVPDRVALMRLYPYPGEFDADDEQQRLAVEGILRDQIANDLIMNVLFGNLTSTDILMFLDSAGIPGLLLAGLESIAIDGFFNYSDLGSRLNMAPATVRARAQALWAAGMLLTTPRGTIYRLAPRARVFLKICNLLQSNRPIDVELAFILGRLGLGSSRAPTVPYNTLEEMIADTDRTPLARRKSLMFEIAEARNGFGMPLSGGPYPVETFDSSDIEWVGR